MTLFGPRVPRTLFVLAAAAMVPGCVGFVPRGRPAARAGDVLSSDRSGPAETVIALVEAHNLERAKRRLPPLAISETLHQAAQRHAADMARRGWISHRGSDGSSPFGRIEQAGYPSLRAGENVAAGQTTTEDVMAGWMSSLGHRRNILGNFTEIGAAHATDRNGRSYWCVTFGTPIASVSTSRRRTVGYP